MIDASEILLGDHDANLNLIEAACRQRNKLLRDAKAAMVMATIKVNDSVQIKHIRPKYLIGATAKVIRKRRTKLEIRLDGQFGFYHAGSTIIIPSSCVKIIDPI